MSMGEHIYLGLSLGAIVIFGVFLAVVSLWERAKR